MLTTYVPDSSHLKSVPSFWHFLLFNAHHHTGSVPLRHDTGERNCSVTPDSLLWFCVWFSLENQFHNLPRAGSIHLTHKAVLETPRNCVDLLQRQNLDHLAHHRVVRSIYLVVAQFGPGLQHQVNCDLCIASVFCELLVPFLLFIFDSFCFCTSLVSPRSVYTSSQCL